MRRCKMRRPEWMLLLAALALVALTAAEPTPAKQQWLASGTITDDTARELGLRIIRRSEVSTLFEADLDSAYRLLNRGHFVAPARFRPAGELARRHFGEALTRNLLEDRPLTAEHRRLVKSLAEAVDADTIRETIRFLIYDEAGARYRSRFAPRPELKQDITPYISARLAAYLAGHGGTVEEEDFQPELPTQYKGEDSVFVNVVARLPGRKTSAHYVVCAHYDAIASRDPLWHEADDAWKTVAAPGANDNATGVAALFEAARLLAGLDLDVGITFIAFSGEELGLLGSDVYADLSETDSIIGVINLDMLGYAEGTREIALTYDLQSRWLSDLMDSTAREASIASPLQTYDGTGTARGDHASFWRAGIPAVMLADAQDGKGNPLYPYYHSTADTLGRVDIEQVCDNARLAVAYLARFAEVQGEALCDIVLTEGSVEWQWTGRSYRPLIAGDSVKAVVRAVNRGGSMLEPVTYGFQIFRGDTWTGRMMYDGTTAIQVPSGGVAEVAASWTTDPSGVGEVPHTFFLRPLTAGVESNTDNNSIVVPLTVMPPSTRVRNLHVFPNPVSRPDQANLRFEILHPESDFTGRLTLSIYDLEGDLAGTAELVRNYLGVKDIEIGVNTVALGSVVPAVSDLAPGLYICVAELAITGQERLVVARSKFAVAR